MGYRFSYARASSDWRSEATEELRLVRAGDSWARRVGPRGRTDRFGGRRVSRARACVSGAPTLQIGYELSRPVQRLDVGAAAEMVRAALHEHLRHCHLVFVQVLRERRLQLSTVR